MRRALPAVVAVIALVVGLAAWLGAGRPPTAGAMPAHSLDSRGGTGCALAAAYLQARGADVAALRRPVRREVLPADAVVLRLGRLRDESPSEREVLQERAWIAAGGRLVLADPGLETTATVVPSLPLWPVTRLTPPVTRTLPGETPGAAVLCAGGKAVVAIERIGGGEVVHLAVPECLDNAHLALADHLALLEGVAGIGSGRPVRFDEYALGRGSGPSLPALLDSFGLLPGAALALLALAAWWWRRAVTVGPPDGAAPEHREEVTDLVDSLGALHQAVLSEHELLAAWEDRLRRLVAQRSRLHGEALERELLRVAGPADDSRPFRERLARLNQAHRRMHHGYR